MADQPILRLSELQAAADIAVDQLGVPGDKGWEVASWSSDDLQTRYLLGRQALQSSFSFSFLRIENALPSESADEPSVFGFNTFMHDVDIRGPAAKEFEGIAFPENREAAKRVVLGHLMTAPVVKPPEPPKRLEYNPETADSFTEQVIEDASKSKRMESYVYLQWQLEEQRPFDIDDPRWDLADEMFDNLMEEYGIAISACNEAYFRCETRLWEAGDSNELKNSQLTNEV